ncbi:MAG: phosphoribosylanthranilate isomerase [Janthinobacterium lividum]
MAQVKICGINSPEAFAAAAVADWIGLNFYPPSPRFVTPAQAASFGPGPTRVGLFVNPTDDDLSATLAVASLDILQLYAPPRRASEIRRRFGLPVWRAVGISDRSHLPTEGEDVDGYVIESKAPPDATRPGGNATPFDWSILSGWTAPLPWLLAGGLDPANVRAAIAASNAPAVDVASGVERIRGVKDAELIDAFIAEARAR